MGTSRGYLRPGCPSATEETCRPQAREGHGGSDRVPPARRSQLTQPTIARRGALTPPLQPLLLVLLALLAPNPCGGFYAGLASIAGGWASPLQQQQQQRFTDAASRGRALHHRVTGAAGGADASSDHASGARQQQQQQQQRRQQQPPPPPPPPPPLGEGSPSHAAAQAAPPPSPMSIETIAAALESGRSQTAPAPTSRYFEGRGWGDGGQQKQRGREGSAEGRRVGGRDPKAFGKIVGGGGTGGGKKSRGNPNKLSLKKRRARNGMDANQSQEDKQLQNDVAAALKAGDAEATLRSFNTAMDVQVPLRPNLLSGVLNQCAKAGFMDDCMRVVVEMKRRGMVIEENTYVPLIRGMVRHGDSQGAFGLVKDMVNQGVQPRLRCYGPVIAGICEEGDMDAAREVWEHMEQQGVVPREEQFVHFLCGLEVAGELWENARSGKLDEKLLEMSYHARNLTMGQAELLEGRFNAVPSSVAVPLPGAETTSADEERQRIVDAVKASPPLARRVKVAGGHEIDDDSWPREWSSKTPFTQLQQPDANTCPACGGRLRAVGLTTGERARIRETLFGLAGLQVKKHARSRHTRLLAKTRQRNGFEASANPSYSFTDEDQQEQLQIFVDWLNSQRADGKTYTAVIDSANVAYHKGSAFHFSLPQVDLMVRALEAKGERPLVVIAEKYIDRVGDLYDNVKPGHGSFKYMCNPLNKAIVQRWRAKSQLYECSDEASDDWYWMYAAVAFDDIPITVISNDRTRDHRMSLAETVPYLRWRTTQLAQFELTYAFRDIMGKGMRVVSWPRNPPKVAIQPPPAFTRDVQRSDQGCWHVPAGADDAWLCIDVQAGLRMGLDKLMPAPRRKRRHEKGAGAARQGDAGNGIDGSSPGELAAGVAATAAASAVAGGDGPPSSLATEDEKLKQVGGLLQSMRVKKQHSRAFRYSTQGTVEEAAMAAKQAAVKGRAAAAAADALVADALFADAQTSGGLDPGSRWAAPLAADALKVKARSAEARFGAGLSEDGLVEGSSERQRGATGGRGSRDGRRELEGTGGRRRGDGVSGTAEGAPQGGAVGGASRSKTPMPATAVGKPATVERAGRARKPAPAAPAPAEPAVAPAEAEAEAEAEVAPAAAANVSRASRRIEHAAEDGPENRSEDISEDRSEGSLEVASEADAGAPVDQEQQQEWASMTVVALRDELRQRGLKVSGKKVELVERLLRA